jgi:site-specific recombinase XerD
VGDVDFKERKIFVRGKRKERVVYFGSPAAKALLRTHGKFLVAYSEDELSEMEP